MSTSRAEHAVRGRFATPWGEGLATVWQGRLAAVELPPLGESVDDVSDVCADPADRRSLDRWVSQLEAYFRGERLCWAPDEVHLEQWAMTPFQRAVYETLLSVPAGMTVSYGALAAAAGYPRAARAVGSAMAANEIPVVVPCHRVIRSDGSLGQYGDDPTWKERLLAHERLHVGTPGGQG